MPGLVPGIHALTVVQKDVDGRDKPGHDGKLFAELTYLWYLFYAAIFRARSNSSSRSWPQKISPDGST
ncbi:hypothetical protein FFI89_014170 [Bradyrhizobium sp. KBS0727]|nr:hypothetical protein FFI71_014165 [Bradyrhizobium sp. KBS0725]QDW44793.1 hypothetical protein FFI89_014170 [Bradyrhizobium sp. KBS0727]